MLGLLLVVAAQAYETDNLTWRHLPLEDATKSLDDRVDEIIAESIEATNQRTSCDADPDKAHRLLAKAIRQRTAVDQLVGENPGIKSLGYDRFGAWIEQGGAPHRSFIDRGDIFTSIKVGESPILKWAGVCSEVRIGPWLVGIDKLDHFFEEGYHAWKKADYGNDVDDALKWATKTELTIYGLETSQTFSYGDLRADYDGMRFYDALLDPDHGVAREGDDGCLHKAHTFAWADRVTWEYDEVMNPPVYSKTAQAAVTRHLEAHRDEYCASYQEWGGEEYLAHLGRVLDDGRPEYAAEDAPPRTDPYRLQALCAGWGEGVATDTGAP